MLVVKVKDDLRVYRGWEKGARRLISRSRMKTTRVQRTGV